MIFRGAGGSDPRRGGRRLLRPGVDLPRTQRPGRCPRPPAAGRRRRPRHLRGHLPEPLSRITGHAAGRLQGGRRLRPPRSDLPGGKAELHDRGCQARRHRRVESDGGPFLPAGAAPLPGRRCREGRSDSPTRPIGIPSPPKARTPLTFFTLPAQPANRRASSSPTGTSPISSPRWMESSARSRESGWPSPASISTSPSLNCIGRWRGASASSCRKKARGPR